MNILGYFEIFEGNLTRLYSPYIYKSKVFQVGIDNLSPYGHFYVGQFRPIFCEKLFFIDFKILFGH